MAWKIGEVRWRDQAGLYESRWGRCTSHARWKCKTNAHNREELSARQSAILPSTRYDPSLAIYDEDVGLGTAFDAASEHSSLLRPTPSTSSSNSDPVQSSLLVAPLFGRFHDLILESDSFEPSVAASEAKPSLCRSDCEESSPVESSAAQRPLNILSLPYRQYCDLPITDESSAERISMKTALCSHALD